MDRLYQLCSTSELHNTEMENNLKYATTEDIKIAAVSQAVQHIPVTTVLQGVVLSLNR